MAFRATFAYLALVLAAMPALSAQQAATPVILDAARRTLILDSISGAMDRMYVFPEVAARVNAELSAGARSGAFDTLTDPAGFARALTARIQAVSHDRHLRVRVGMGGPPMRVANGPGMPRGNAPRMFGRTERLEGNVAYVEILTFGVPVDAVRDAIREAMSAAADASALILDVRANGGGQPQAVALVSSYLFGDVAVHLNSLHWREGGRVDHFHTEPAVPGSKFGPDKPVFVLTSNRTFSAAEEFAYNLQSRRRATIVGETTGGGAHPGRAVPLPDGLSIFVSTGRAVNPITGTNWEGTGVRPDVESTADAALETALRLARAASGATSPRP